MVDEIMKMSRTDVEEKKRRLFSYSVKSPERDALIDACDRRLELLRTDTALVERSDIDMNEIED